MSGAEDRVCGRDPATGTVRTVTIRDGLIAAIGPGGPDDGAYLALGLFDLQVNGYRGHDLNRDPDPTRVRDLVRAVVESGVSRFAPTIVTASRSGMLGALRAVAAARETDPLARDAIPFIHVEGPHVAPEDGPRGAHPARHVRPPDLAEFDAWQAASGGLVGLVTLSPHWPETAAYVRALAHRGVRVAIGHTGAGPDAIRAAAEAGATLSTHLGNGIAATLARHPNPFWSQLAEDRLFATFIADGHHLPAETLTAMLRAKGLARSILVSDTVAPAGMPPGLYDASVGGRVELSTDGRLGLLGTPFLAGAALPLLAGVATAMRQAGLSLGDALALASANPRAAFGLPGLAVGAPADLLRFRPADGMLAAETVYVAGRPVACR